MKLILMTFIGLLLFSSCGLKLKDHNRVEGGREFNTTNPVFNSYIQKFEAQGKTQTGNQNFTIGDIPINFKDLPGGDVQGVCNEYSDGTKEILIKKSWWDNVDEGFRESLLYHELGHCRLGREHDDKMIQVGSAQYKSSLMHTFIVDSPEYTMLQSDYFKELFTHDTSSLTNTLLNSSASSQ